MDQQLVIKLTTNDGTGVPIGPIDSSPPLLYTNLKHLYPDFAFSEKATPSETESFGYGVYERIAFNPDIPYNKTAVDTTLAKQDDGVWRNTLIIRDATPEEIYERTEAKAKEVRRIRDRDLRLTDWTRLDDVNLSDEKKNQYLTYRNLLRDVPQQPGFPWNINYPTLTI
jgi:hypothetical protein